ncbi:MAG: nitroreductase family protein [Proteobacteria bacterium]|nr:nitroreductase family protein [Pseudomonadota bacterium]
MKEHASVPLSDFHEYPVKEMIARSRSFYEDIKRRHSIRSFSDRAVPREIIENCIRSAGTAPSGANHQPWHFAAIGSPDAKKAVREKAEVEERAFYEDRKAGETWLNALEPLGTDADKAFLETAPWLIAIFTQRRGGVSIEDHQKNYYVPESVGIATGFLINALHSCGLATLTHTPNPMKFLNEVCKRGAGERPYLLLVTGYPAPDATVPEHAQIKKSLEDISSFL